MNKVSVNTYKDDKYYPRIMRAVETILKRQNYVSPFELFQEMGLVTRENAKKWKQGQVPYFEKVVNCNLSKASRVLRILRFHAHDLNLGPSMTVYKHKGRSLKFSKSGIKPVEEAYSRHFVIIGKRNPWKDEEKAD